MSIRNTVTSFLTIAFSLSLAGVAFARQPPALTAVQRQAARAVACEGATPRSTAGYRDAFHRTAPGTQASPLQVAGYRGKFVISGAESAAIACTDARRLSAQR